MHYYLMDNDQARGQAAQDILDARALRQKIFPGEIFDEYAWSILLVLFAGFTRGEVLSEESVLQRAGVGVAPGRRWIAHLVQDNQVMARRDGDDVTLTPDAITRFRTYFDDSHGMTEGNIA